MAVEYRCLYCRCGTSLVAMATTKDVQRWRQEHTGRGHGECSREAALRRRTRRDQALYQRVLAGQPAQDGGR